jgi:hypothetical protein
MLPNHFPPDALFISWGGFQVGAFGRFAVGALIMIMLLLLARASRPARARALVRRLLTALRRTSLRLSRPLPEVPSARETSTRPRTSLPKVAGGSHAPR